jgi:hypothetical protein
VVLADRRIVVLADRRIVYLADRRRKLIAAALAEVAAPNDAEEISIAAVLMAPTTPIAVALFEVAAPSELAVAVMMVAVLMAPTRRPRPNDASILTCAFLLQLAKAQTCARCGTPPRLYPIAPPTHSPLFHFRSQTMPKHAQNRLMYNREACT